MRKIGTWFHRFFSIAAVVGVAGTLGLTSSARSERLDPPVRIFVRTLDGKGHRGLLTAYDAQGLKLAESGKHGKKEDKKHERSIAWDDLPPGRVLTIQHHLIAPGDASAWLALGIRLHERDDAKEQAEVAFRKALAIDPALQDQVDRARRGEPIDPDAAAAESDSDDRGAAGHGGGVGPDGGPGPAEPGGEGGDDSQAPGGVTQNPDTVGYPQAKYWGTLDDKVMDQSVDELKKFALKTQKRMNLRLSLYETKYYLFYSDLSDNEARRWAGLLDKMYGRLCKLFGIADGRNIYRGKGLIMVFSQESDYQRFELMMHHTNPGGSAGMTHTFGNGYVHIAFYRQPDSGLFGHVLVHENVHGFLHRFKSPVHIPTWANEGLAETIAQDLVPRSTQDDSAVTDAFYVMRRNKTLGGFFYAPGLAYWQYGVARLMTQFMLHEGKPQYAKFIEGIKKGEPWIKSLKDHMHVTPEQLTAAFGRSEHIRGLKP